MACKSLKGLARFCGTSLAGGASQIFVIAYADLVNLDNSMDKYTTDPVTGLVDNIGVAEGKKFVEIGIYQKASNGITSTLTKDNTVGSAFFTQSVQFQLRGITQENKEFLEDSMMQEVVFIIRDKQGQYFAAGLGGQIEMESIDGGMGLLDADGQATNVTFTGNETTYFSLVDPTLVPYLLLPACPRPVISSQPAGSTIDSGDTATLSVTASPATKYQWQVLTAGVWTEVPGANSSSYTTGALSDNASYRVIVSNECTDGNPSRVISNVATIIVE